MGKIRCIQCDIILESKSVHDFVVCRGCKNVAIDGGDQYMKISFPAYPMDKYVEILDDPSKDRINPDYDPDKPEGEEGE